MEQAKIRPSITLYSLDRSLPNLVWLITSATRTHNKCKKKLPFYMNYFMTHIKRQKLILTTQLRGYYTQFLLYPQALSWWNWFLPLYMCHERWALNVVIKRKFFLHLYLQFFSTIFYAISFTDTCLMNRQSIYKPKFDKISQSMAEMNYFRFPFQVSILTYV